MYVLDAHMFIKGIKEDGKLHIIYQKDNKNSYDRKCKKIT